MSYTRFSARISAFATPLAVHTATAPPTRIIVSPPPPSAVRFSASSSSVTASAGMTLPSLSMIVSIALGLATRLKTPTLTSSSAGIARKA